MYYFSFSELQPSYCNMLRGRQMKSFIILLTFINFMLLLLRSGPDATGKQSSSSSKHPWEIAHESQLMVHQETDNPKLTKENAESVAKSKSSASQEKLILAYTKFYGNMFDVHKAGRTGYDIKQSPNAFDQCEYKCRWSTDKADLSKSDAVLFHLYNNRNNKDFIFKDLPPRSNALQKWVLMAREPQAFFYPEQLKSLDDKFNLTVTFQSDSDVVIPYGTYWELPKKSQDYWAKLKMDYLSGKNKSVAWVVSNCKTSSRREDYVRELQKHIQVDVYGRCGTLKTNTQSANGFRDQIAKEYKFYIAFENSDCDDYISEKFWNSLNIGIIPIVRGHRAHYKEVAPPNSYIHADSFVSPQKLAEHLEEVSKNPTLFQSYHEWRRKYGANYKFFTTNTNWMCGLCEKVHTTPVKTVDIYQHFSEDTRCFTYLDHNGRNRTGEHVEDITRV